MGRFLYFCTNLSALNKVEVYMEQSLQSRKTAGNYRELKPTSTLVDFCSNDYLGFSQSPVLKQYIDDEINSLPVQNGSRGSRLLAGNTDYAVKLEQQIAQTHGFQSALLYNSGYDANIGLFSSLPQRGDTVITDELIHASIIDGIRLSNANRYTFKHNDLLALEQKLKNATGRVYVAVESIYSMDGDSAPLAAIAELTDRYEAILIVDEAHATGPFGLGLVEQAELQHQVFAKIITYGKAMGCHGAAIVGRQLLHDYLVNFSRSFIYTTAAPLHQFVAIKMAYLLLEKSSAEAERLHQHIYRFKNNIKQAIQLLPSDSAIQCIVAGSNEKARSMAAHLQNNSFDVRAVLSPTVAVGTERLRICLHASNTNDQIDHLTTLINNY